jgi:predicted ArsR family transcriptional regulator
MAFNSRQRILEHLKKSGQASVAELSRALGLTPVTIRHHLEALRGEGLVARPVARRKAGPGRPEMMYSGTAVADAQMPRNYGELCGCLIRNLRSPARGRDLGAVLVAVGSELGRREPVPAGPGRLRFIRHYLEERGYFPTTSQSAGRIRLELANCPYLEVAREFPSLCQLDRALLESLFGRPVAMGGRIVLDQPVCTFEVAET